MSDQNEMNLGGKLGPRMAKIVADALVFTRQRMGPHQAGVAQLVLQEFTNHVSDEIRGAMGPVWDELARHPDTPEQLVPLFTALANERGQAWAWIGGNLTGAATGASVGGLFDNLLAPAIQSIIMHDPNGLLSPEAIATAIARGISKEIQEVPLVDESRKGGLSAERLMYLVELARATPTVTELQVMLNRGTIDRKRFNTGLERLGFDDKWRQQLYDLAHADVSLPEISAMWNRSIIDDTEARKLGQRVGYDATDVARALELGGEPLGVQQLADAYRRGFIDEARFQRGVVQGPIRNEWFDVLEKLQFSRMSTVDAADAVNQGHMSLTEGKRVAHENGLEPDDFQVLIESAGAPPGIEFATEALNRGFLTQEQFRAIFLESRIKNRYLQLLLDMRTRLIPQETARLAYREGVYSKEDALRTLQQHGYTPEDAATLLAIEDSRQDETTKELTRAQIVQMYDEQILDAATTKGLLESLGYSSENVGLMMALADVKRSQRYVNAAITRIRSAYLTGKVDENEVIIQLDALGVPTTQREELLHIWGIDKSTITKTLTATQIRQAFNKTLITRPDALARLVAQGYDEIDADLFLRLTA
jgi:uncharacterized protein YidB (DUF937 family)